MWEDTEQSSSMLWYIVWHMNTLLHVTIVIVDANERIYFVGQPKNDIQHWNEFDKMGAVCGMRR